MNLLIQNNVSSKIFKSLQLLWMMKCSHDLHIAISLIETEKENEYSKFIVQIIWQVTGNETLALETSNTKQVTMETRHVTKETKKEFHEYAATFSETSRDTGSAGKTSVAQTYSYTPSTQTLASSQWQPPVSAPPWQPMTSSPRPPPTTSVTWYYHPHF